MSWLSAHWPSILTALGATGGVGASLKFFPRFWRGVARIVASPILLEIARETQLAREEQIADLLEIIEDQRRERDRADPAKGSLAD